MDFKALMLTKEYDFLRTNERLGSRMILLGLGGSHAYGTCNENSDVDFRGVTLSMPSDLLGLTRFEQYEDRQTDTVIYSFNKIIRLLLECNPNTCELLGRISMKLYRTMRSAWKWRRQTVRCRMSLTWSRCGRLWSM